MKNKRSDPPSNVVNLPKAVPPEPGSATELEGLELVRVFLTIRSKQSRKDVLVFARQIAADDANAAR
jgi:hypothetical protein